MYTQDFWDNIYNLHFQDAPWMDDSWKTSVITTIEEDMKTYTNGLYGQWLLDYGCGNGHMGVSFLKLGLKVDLADISKVLVGKLKEEYDGQSDINIYRATMPSDLPKSRKYDIIIAWNLFHHLHPSTWHQFLFEFCGKMRVGGLLLISGWDENDSIIKNDNNKAKYTQQDTWFVNDLPNHVEDIPFVMVKNVELDETVPVFQNQRSFRYFIFRKIRKNNYKKVSKP